jgi:hypothetical protein
VCGADDCRAFFVKPGDIFFSLRLRDKKLSFLLNLLIFFEKPVTDNKL